MLFTCVHFCYVDSEYFCALFAFLIKAENVNEIKKDKKLYAHRKYSLSNKKKIRFI